MLVKPIQNQSEKYSIRQNNHFVDNSSSAIISHNNILKDTVSFKGYRGVDWYGTQENRDNLAYRVKLTPSKIDTIIQGAKTTDEGLVDVYKALSEESSHINKAFMGMSVVTKQYLFVAKDRITEVAKDKPKGSNIPIISIIPQTLSKITGSFIDRITGYTDNLIDDYNQIVEKHFHNSVNHMIEDYVTSSRYFQEGIKYVNMVDGKTQLRVDLLEKVSQSQDAYVERYNELNKSLKDLGKTLSSTTDKVLEEQCKRQNKRLVKKAVIKVITAGLG